LGPLEAEGDEAGLVHAVNAPLGEVAPGEGDDGPAPVAGNVNGGPVVSQRLAAPFVGRHATAVDGDPHRGGDPGRALVLRLVHRRHSSGSARSVARRTSPVNGLP